MWNYEKRLQFPVNIKTCCPKTASLIISQFGGPDGELAASMRYLSQRYSMPCKKVAGLLTDIGTEELAHMEMICAMIYQLTKNMTIDDARTAGFDAYYVDPVSYTHLDVYKRQGFVQIWPAGPEILPKRWQRFLTIISLWK